MGRQQIGQTKLGRKTIDQSSVRRYQIESSYAKNENYQKTKFTQRPVERYILGKMPKLKNQIQLQLPTQRQPTIQTYVKDDGLGFLQKIFPCCYKPIIQPDFVDCDYCDRRIDKREGSTQYDKQDASTPYFSYQRILQRQKQPVNIFYEQITNQKIKNNRFNFEEEN